MNQKNLNYEIETEPTPDLIASANAPMNQKNLNYEIETRTRSKGNSLPQLTMNQKNLNYEIETFGWYLVQWRCNTYESKESQL